MSTESPSSDGLPQNDPEVTKAAEIARATDIIASRPKPEAEKIVEFLQRLKDNDPKGVTPYGVVRGRRDHRLATHLHAMNEATAETGLVRYDAMVHAIAQCVAVDELADMHNKALAMERYAKQAHNVEAERQAANIRLRAERRWGQLAKELERIEPAEKAQRANQSMGNDVPATVAGTSPAPSPYRQAIKQSGISERTAERWQKIAAIPDEIFEEHLNDKVSKPTTSALLERAAVPMPKKRSAELLTFWGLLRRVEEEHFFPFDPKQAFSELTETMQEDVVRLLPLVIKTFTTFHEAIK